MSYENPYSGQSPILGPIMRALQIYKAQKDIDYDAADRQFRNEEFSYRKTRDAHNEDYNERQLKFYQDKESNDQQTNAINRVRDLNAIGAHIGNPTMESALTAALGAPKDARQAVTIENGQTFYLPTEKEQRNKAMQNFLDQARLTAAADLERTRAMFPYKVGEIEARQRYEQQYATPPAPRMIQTDQAGMGVDPRTGQTVWTRPELAKQKSAAEKKAADPAAAAETERRRVQSIIDKARQAGEFVKRFEIFNEKNPGIPPTAQQKSAYLKAKADMITLWQNAAREAQIAAQKHPDYLEGGPGQGGFAFIQSKRR
jgi:hypothetical protein